MTSPGPEGFLADEGGALAWKLILSVTFDLEAELQLAHHIESGAVSEAARRAVLRRCEGSLDELGPDGSQYFGACRVR